MLISAEFELPAIHTDPLEPVQPEVFQSIWTILGLAGWQKESFGVRRPATASCPDGCAQSDQVISTDSGPTIEIAPTPSMKIGDIEQQLIMIKAELAPLLKKRQITLLGSGVNPTLDGGFNEYLRYRTPRKAYDYAIKKRGWNHHSIINIAATQEVIDVPVGKAIRVLNFFHRIAGVMLFLFRNDPDYSKKYGGRLSVRPEAWKRHVPGSGQFGGDRHKVWLPEEPIKSWDDYLRLLWETSPMFIFGTKNNGAVFVKDHPTFWKFITEIPKNGWTAEIINDGDSIQLFPEFGHLVQTDWSYMGFARLRWQWKDDASLVDLISAREQGKIDRFMADNLKKIMIENRSTATQLPGEELCSLAFTVGLLTSFEQAEKLANSQPYEFWLSLANAAEFQPLRSNFDNLYVPAICRAFLEIAMEGLALRNLDEKKYLRPLFERLTDGRSPSEKMLELFNKDGLPAVIQRVNVFG